MSGYCTVDDVGSVMQDDFNGSPKPAEVQDAIAGQNEWLRRRTHSHWFNSTAGTDQDTTNDFLHTSAESVTDVRLDVPSSPHRQDRQLFSSRQGVRYPVTHAGPYAKVRLPHRHVQSLSTLEVRDSAGGVEDWVAGTQVEGRGDDYYVATDGEYGISHLFIRAASIGPRVDYGDLLTVDYDYGVDGIPDSVRRAVAFRAGAELVMDDDAAIGIPSDGQLVSLESKADQYHKKAMKLLAPYLETPVA